MPLCLEKVHFNYALTAQSLDAVLRRELEIALDADLSALRVHDNPFADRLASNLGAEAVTVGSDVFFRRGCFNSRTAAGRWLLAHEAMHVAQQSSVGTETKGARATLGCESDVWEQEADVFATAFVTGAPIVRRSSNAMAGAPPVIQRHVSFEHRALGDLSTDDLVAVARSEGTKRTEIIDRQIQLMMLWHDKPDQVKAEQVTALCPWIRTLTLGPDNVLLTYGEVNALPDYFANPGDIANLSQKQLLPILQVIRQEGYNMFSKLKSGGTPNWVFPDVASQPWSNSTFNAIMETRDLDNFTKGFGPNGINHYGGLLSRNACHFAPYSWYRWSTSHIIARDLAEKAFAIKDKDSEQYKSLARQAWTYHGYADHFLQDSFAAGHLINKTMVMQWWVEWAKPTWLFIDDWDLIRGMTVKNQPNLASLDLYKGFTGHSNDPQTVEELASMNDRMKGTGVQAYIEDTGRQVDGLSSYQRYLSFLSSGIAQVASNALHDVFNSQSVWVSSQERPTGYQVWGDDTLFGSADNGKPNPDRGTGVEQTSIAAQLSQTALLEILANGSTGITPESIWRHFPTKAGDDQYHIVGLDEWTMQQRTYCDSVLFPSPVLRGKDTAIMGIAPRLSPLSKDEDFVEWQCDLPGSGYHNTDVITFDGRLFAACAGYIYELNPTTGEAIRKTSVGTGSGSVEDYTTKLATDGNYLFLGTHGYVYALSLNDFGQAWYVGVGEHGYHRVNVAVLGGQLYAGCNGHVYLIDRLNGHTLGNIDLGMGDQTLNYDGRYLLAGRNSQVAAIAVPDASNPTRFEVVWQSAQYDSRGEAMPILVLGSRILVAADNVYELNPSNGVPTAVFGPLAYKDGSGPIRLAGDGNHVVAGYSDLAHSMMPFPWQATVGSFMTERGNNTQSFPVTPLFLKGRLFTGSNGYVYELEPDTGAIRQWKRPTSAIGVGDYDTHLATDGEDLFIGVHGYVYKLTLARR